MPHKKFQAKAPDPNSPTAGIPAHAMFTSPLIATPEEAEAKAKETLAKAYLKSTGDVKVAQLDEQGNPTGNWITLGQISDFKFEPMLEQIAENVQVSEDDYGVSIKGGIVGHSKTHLLEHGATLIEYPDGMSTLDLPGTVSVPGQGIGKIHGKFTFPTWQARQIAGLDPKQPGVSLPSTAQWLYGQPYVWDHEEGWVSAVWAANKTKNPTLSNHASGTALDANALTANGGWCAPAGSDHMHFELGHEEAFAEAVDQGEKVKKLQAKIFYPAGSGYPVVVTDAPVSTAPEDLLTEAKPSKPVDDGKHWAGPVIHPLSHLWCTACDVHWLVHTGDPVACDSGGYLRPSTPLEDKQVLERIKMLHDTGLMPKHGFL